VCTGDGIPKRRELFADASLNLRYDRVADRGQEGELPQTEPRSGGCERIVAKAERAQAVEKQKS